MRQRLILKDAKLVKLAKYPGDETTTQVLNVRALFTLALAEQLKCRELCFDEKGVPRRFEKLKLTQTIEDCEVLFGENPETLLANEVSHFSVGRPKEATETNASLEVVLSLHFAGSVALSEWFDAQNKAEFQMTVKPPEGWNAQLGLFEEGAREEVDDFMEDTCVDCANGIGKEPGDPSRHLSGQPCTAYKAPPVAAPTPPAERIAARGRKGRGAAAVN